ncbi:chitinase-3-like protein 1 [Chironomus tepperi]|uniref:chitinase-3-like protein 1 n=1 Tax=Chironomus tepperi TaxID=113505 RepID=UPI00391F3043
MGTKKLEILTICLEILVILSLSVKCNEFKCPEGSDKKIFCYYKVTGQESNEVNPSSIFHHNKPPCSHIIYAFAGLDMDGNIVLPHKRVSHDLHDLMRLKEKDPCLKILISVGGWNEGSEKFSSLVETENSIENFAEKALKFLIFYGFDGIDIHWMYPTMRGGIKDDRKNFVNLIKALKSKLSKRNKLVVAAIGTKISHITESYSPMKELCDSLDYAILMTYDYYDRTKTSIGAPLVNDDHHIYKETVAENIQRILLENCKAEKLIFGISTYGKVYELKRSSRTGIGADLSDEDVDVNGQFVEYNKICTALRKNLSISGNHNDKTVKWTTKLLPKSHSKYAFHDRTWVSYDDHEAVEIKTLYALKKNLGGVMFYTLNGDNFNEDCKVYFPLITRAKKLIGEFTAKCKSSDSNICLKKIEQEHNLHLSIH